MKKEPGLLLANPNFKHTHNPQTHKNAFIHQNGECEFVLKKRNSTSAGLATLQHQQMCSPLTTEQKWSTRRGPSQPMDTQQSPAVKTIKNQIGNAQKYKISGAGKKKIKHRYISLYLFVLKVHFNEILHIFPLLWDKKQKPVIHKVMNAFTSSMLGFWTS